LVSYLVNLSNADRGVIGYPASTVGSGFAHLVVRIPVSPGTLWSLQIGIDRPLYIAKGVHAEFGHDWEGSELEKGTPEKRWSQTASRWIKFLVAIILGNALYFALSQYFPPAARHATFKFDLGTIIDFWFCLMVYGVIELLLFLHGRGIGDRDEGRRGRH